MCHLDTHGDKPAGQYLSAVLREMDISAFFHSTRLEGGRARGGRYVEKEDINLTNLGKVDF